MATDNTTILGVVGESGPNFNQAADVFRMGSQADLIVSILRGKYDELVERGRVFIARVNTAASVPVNSTLTNAPVLWNPTGNTVNVKLLKINFSVGAVGTPILQGFTLSYLNNTGAFFGTGAPVITFTPQAVVNAKLGMGYAGQCLFAPAVVTYTTQPAPLMDLGIGHMLEGSAASGYTYNLSVDLDGTAMIPPGSLVALGSTIASSTTYYTSFIYAEVPVPLGATW